MTDIVKLLKSGTEKEREAYFLSEARNMWEVRDKGVKVNLPLNFESLRQEGMLKRHIKTIKKYFSVKGVFVDNVTYYYFFDGDKLNIFVEETDGGFDWKQNFLAFNFKVKIGEEYRRYHLGFYATALTVFKDLQYRGLLKPETIVDLYGYSHGAGALPSLFSMIKNNTDSLVMENIKKFEPPRDIYLPNKNVKEECESHFNFIQGIDIVTKVPWWMQSIGVKINIKGRNLPLLKGILKAVFDHDIYWTEGE